MRLACHVVNEVPPELFDVALTESPGPPPSRSLFEVVRAYHWCERMSLDGSEKEVWASKDLGRRQEIRRGGELQFLRIDTPAWSLLWRPSLNRATLLPSRLADLVDEDGGTIEMHGTAIRYAEELTAMFRLQKEQLNGKEVDKVTEYYPADPQVAGEWPIHTFDPEMQRKVPGTQMRTRTYWFDHETGLMVQRRCGCKSPKHDENADYPPPESTRPERFAFQLPQGARLESADERLERLFRSQQ